MCDQISLDTRMNLLQNGNNVGENCRPHSSAVYD